MQPVHPGEPASPQEVERGKCALSPGDLSTGRRLTWLPCENRLRRGSGRQGPARPCLVEPGISRGLQDELTVQMLARQQQQVCGGRGLLGAGPRGGPGPRGPREEMARFQVEGPGRAGTKPTKAWARVADGMSKRFLELLGLEREEGLRTRSELGFSVLGLWLLW